MRAQMRSRVFNVRSAHVPPRRKGENESPRKCQYRFPAAIPALYRICGDTPKAWPKTMAKTAIGALQHPGRRHQRPFQIEAGGAHGSPDATKSSQEARKSCPRDVQERPKAAEKQPECGQDKPMVKTAIGVLRHPGKRHQRFSQIEVGGAHESPDATKSVQETRNRCPRDALERPKAAEQRPKCGQNASKTGQGDTQTPPKTNPASLKTRLAHDRDRQPGPPGCRNDFSRLMASRTWRAKCVATH